jgi:hypothetical protein
VIPRWRLYGALEAVATVLIRPKPACRYWFEWRMWGNKPFGLEIVLVSGERPVVWRAPQWLRRIMRLPS